jgi:outer membrane protein assembly factor BamC
VNQFSRLALLGITVALGACSVLEGDKIDYRSSGKGPSLEVPPDLTQLSRDGRYTVAGGSVSASSYQTTSTGAPGTPTALSAAGDVRMERAGSQRWLVVNRPAEQVWGPTRDFWQENGFLLAQEQANLGIMETDWAENRAKLPNDMLRNALGKVLDSLYSTGERDKFRTRLERSASGGTEIYISHRGMVEVYTTTQKDQTIWQPRAADPELEAEFLRRLLVKLGLPQDQAKKVVADTASAKDSARVTTGPGQAAVQLDEGFDRAWRRVGLALDRTGFTVEDRDRGQGTYFVRYVAPGSEKGDGSFFGKLFGGTPVAPLKYRVLVRSQGESTSVTVLDDKGQSDTSPNAQRILKLLADDLK